MNPEGFARRTLLAAAAAGALPAAASAAEPPPGLAVAATRAALSRLPASPGVAAYLSEPGRAGIFEWREGDHAARVAGDPLQGLFLPGASDPSARGGCWVRAGDLAQGRPEYWGARGDDPAFDCLPALQACIAHCAETLLSTVAYHISDTLRIAHDNRTISGVCRSDEFTRAPSSAIVLTGAHAADRDVLLIGHPIAFRPAGPPPAGWVHSVRARRFDVRRTAPPAGYAAGTEALGAAGVRCLWTSQIELEGIHAPDHAIGFYWGACVYCRASWLEAYRARAAPGGDDFWIGFFVDGNYALGTTYAGGNASLYFNQCKAGISIAPRNRSNGFLITGGFADTFLTECESYGSPKRAMVIDGARDHPDGGVRKSADADLHLTRPILDGAGEIVLEISRLAAYATIDIRDAYCAVGGTADQALIAIHDGGGSITISGGEALGWPNAQGGGSAYGLSLTNQTGVHVDGLKLTGCVQPVAARGCSAFHLAPVINNPREGSGRAAIALAGCTRGRITPTIFAAPDPAAQRGWRPFGDAVTIDAASSAVAVDATLIDPACLAGAVLRVAGSVVSKPGPFGRNCLLGGIVG